MIWALLCGLFYGALLQDAWRRELERRRFERVQKLEREWYACGANWPCSCDCKDG